jgi:hypothetical protein
MSDGSRVPITIGGFNTFIVTAGNRMQATNPATSNLFSKDYGVTDADALSWKTQQQNWVDNVYATYIDATLSTSIAKDNVHTFMDGFRGFAGPVLNTIAASAIAGNAEEHIFNFVLHRKNPVHATAAIADECFTNLHGMGRGLYEATCRGAQDGSRASKVHGADSIQYAYTIVAAPPTTPPAPNDPTMSTGIATTAIFQHDFGAANITKYLIIYFRWYNTKHPNLAGAWSAMQMVAIG